MLEKYREKRDFERTPEPAPDAPARRRGALMFVVQKHDATRLHYDFRLEVDGVLKSWPIPKGPSYDPREKRLAVMVEDHPLDYASFEGIIPKGSYGAGEVIVWDAGTYSPDEDGQFSWEDREEAEERMRQGIRKGKLSVFLRGHKLKGSWTLVKIAKSDKDWLFIKHKDRFTDPDREVTQEDASVISGLTIADLRAGRLPDRAQKRLVVYPWDAPGAREAPPPKTLEPMQATLTKEPFSLPDWTFEPKLDGVRGIAWVDSGKVRLCSRRGLDNTHQYPAIVEELGRQTERMVLDGEIVAFDENGVPSFQRMQQRLNLGRAADIRRMDAEIPAFYYAFDLLWAGGWDLRGCQLRHRKQLLHQLLLPDEHIRRLEHFDGEGEAAYEAAVQNGLEGLVAKRWAGVYESGKRTRTWLKIKHTKEDDFIIGGYTEGAGGRSQHFGALLLGTHDDEGRLVYVGHVGTGFDERALLAIKKKLDALKTDKSPFDVMKAGNMRFGRGPRNLPTTWVKPQLVATVEFAQWTDDGHLRAPSFKGLRPDKDPRDVRREVAVPAPPEATPASGRDGSGGDGVAAVLEQLARDSDRFVLKVMGQKVSLTNLDKPFWPEYEGRRALTKRDLLVYLARISPYLLPHMRDRPLTLTRYPNGVLDSHFYQKHWEAPLPAFVERVLLWSEQFREDQDYLLCNNLPTLLWLGQIADIELHTWYSRVDPQPDAPELPQTFTGSARNFGRSLLNYPDFIVFDLDPYIYAGHEARGEEPQLNRKAFQKTCEVGFWLKDVLDSLSLSSFVKTTGKTGLHIYVPILRQLTYDETRAAADTIGRFILRAHPKDVTMEWSTAKRTGKVFFDHNQNTKGKTLASIYSPRPTPWAGVSMPVRWDELRDIYPPDFNILNACDRVEKTGDLWANILNEKHDISQLLQATGAE